MNKKYIAPSVEIFEVQASALMAQSLGIDSTKTVNTSDEGAQLGRENTSGSSLWDQEW